MMLRADTVQILIDRTVSGQHQVIAVVDYPIESGVEIGAATPARLPRRLEQGYGNSARRQMRGGGKTGQPRPDHMGMRGRFHRNFERNTSDSSLPLLSETRRRGGAKPAASLALRISE